MLALSSTPRLYNGVCGAAVPSEASNEAVDAFCNSRE